MQKIALLLAVGPLALDGIRLSTVTEIIDRNVAKSQRQLKKLKRSDLLLDDAEKWIINVENIFYGTHKKELIKGGGRSSPDALEELAQSTFKNLRVVDETIQSFVRRDCYESKCVAAKKVRQRVLHLYTNVLGLKNEGMSFRWLLRDSTLPFYTKYHSKWESLLPEDVQCILNKGTESLDRAAKENVGAVVEFCQNCCNAAQDALVTQQNSAVTIEVETDDAPKLQTKPTAQSGWGRWPFSSGASTAEVAPTKVQAGSNSSSSDTNVEEKKDQSSFSMFSGFWPTWAGTKEKKPLRRRSDGGTGPRADDDLQGGVAIEQSPFSRPSKSDVSKPDAPKSDSWTLPFPSLSLW